MTRNAEASGLNASSATNESSHSSIYSHFILRQALETILCNLIREQENIRIATTNNRVDAFYFFGRFSASTNATNSAFSIHGENSGGSIHRHWIDNSTLILDLTRSNDALPSHNNSVDIPMIIVGIREPRDGNSPSIRDTENNTSGWIMYVVGGPRTATALEQLTELNSRYQRQPEIDGMVGRFVLMMNNEQRNIPQIGNARGSFIGLFLGNLFSNLNSTDRDLQDNFLEFRNLLSLNAAGLMASEEGPYDSYDLFLHLAEILGNVKDMRAPREEVEKQLPEIKYSIFKKSIPKLHVPSSSSCPVCLALFEDEELIRELKCNHFFHKDCIDTWLCNHVNTCPMCRNIAVSVSEEM
jgi:hypothetical protein